MATAWYVQKNEKQVGPFSGKQLRELALAGKLQTDDLVRKGDVGEFMPASRVNNLFAPDQMTTRSTPPPPRLPSMAMSVTQASSSYGSVASSSESPSRSNGGPAEDFADSKPMSTSQSWFSQLKQYLVAARTKLADFGKQAAEAGELGKLVARRTQLQQHQLPQAFSALGAQVYAERRFAEEFPNHFAEIDEAISQQSELAERETPEGESENFTGRMKGFADGLLRRGKGAAIGLTVKSLQRKVGEVVYRQHGPQSGSAELVAPIEKADAEIGELQRKIDELDSSSSGRVLTPKRLLIAGAILGCVLMVLSLRSVVSRGSASTTEAFFDGLPTSIDSKEYAGKEITVSGIWSNMGNARNSDYETIEDQIQVTLDTEFKGVSARCRFNREDEEAIRDTTKSNTQLTVTGTLVGRFPFPDRNVHILILDNCVIDDMRKEGHETIQKFSRHLQLPKADSFMKQLAVMQGITEDTPPPKRNYDSYSGLFLEPRHYYKVGIELYYDEWVEAFGEPTSVREGPHGGHVWQQVYNGKVVYLNGALKTGLHFAPMIKVRRLDPNAYPESQWKVILHAVSVD